MLIRLYQLARWLSGRDPLYPLRSLPDAYTILRGRYLTIYPDDVFLVSYPRSGNTWMRFLIGNLLSPDTPVTFANVEARIPDVYRHSDQALSQYQRPRIIKSHEYLLPRYSRVIYMVRDPRDVAVSYYHWLRKINFIAADHPLHEFIPQFIQGSFEPFGTWGDHVGGWVGARSHRSDFLLIRYEDLQHNSANVLRHVADFLTLHATDMNIAQAVERSSFAQMRLMEQAQAEQWVTTQNTRQDIPFVRSSTIGEWQQAVDPASIAAIEQAWSAPMRQLGYLFD